MLLEQFQAFWERDTGIQRTQLAQIERAAHLPHAVIISGLRRAGKSTLLELFGERKIFIVDEVQNIPQWEDFVRRFIDMGFKFYISGSNASLLSRELGTRLTGRYVPIELFPFSFSEFMQFRKVTLPDLERLTTPDMAQLQYHLSEYLRLGSVNTVKNYIEYLENSWLFLIVNVYDHSVKRQQIAPKKVYPIDTGLARAVGFAFSANTGKLLENAVFLALRRRTQEIFYYATPGGYEVDFYLPESGELIQVTQALDMPATREREVRATVDAMRALGLGRAMILAEANAPAIIEGGFTIEIRSAAEWLLKGE